MSLENSHIRHTDSPPSSGRSSPVPRATRRTVEDGLYKADKSLKRYAANIERALATWEISPEEWADYIAFLGRLLKAIQTHPKDAPILPHSNTIATRLAQCLNPALPSGVHQKALDVYTYIFATSGNDHIGAHVHEYLPGLVSVLSFASLSVRPGLYSLLENHIVVLPATDLRPALKSILLGLLPALEEENSEDFERAYKIVQSLESRFAPQLESEEPRKDIDGYFWQCLFLAVITSPSRRQGALNFLSRDLPKLAGISQDASRLSPAARCVVSPEPGLLLRCFVCGLSDGQLLIQRGFLDLLVARLPLDSPVLQYFAGDDDLDRLVSAAIQVLLRRDMSLNRRLWGWFLGPDPKEQNSADQASSPTLQRKSTHDDQPSAQMRFFTKYGQPSLQRCILKMLRMSSASSSEKARPFRVCLSLMDRWEIGGLLVPEIFLPAMTSLYEYSLTADAAHLAEVVRSANLFFDGVEASLIWESIITVLNRGFEGKEDFTHSFRQAAWIVRTFNINDEEMITEHIPSAALFLLTSIEATALSQDNALQATAIALQLVELVPSRMFQETAKGSGVGDLAYTSREVRDVILGSYTENQNHGSRRKKILQPTVLLNLLIRSGLALLEKAIGSNQYEISSKIIAILISLLLKAGPVSTTLMIRLHGLLVSTVRSSAENDVPLPFAFISSIIGLIANLRDDKDGHGEIRLQVIHDIGPGLLSQLWRHLSPAAPKHHVEAVKAFWQVESLIASEDITIARLNELIRTDESRDDNALVESIRSFQVLWSHTVSVGSSRTGPARRGSGMSVLSDPHQQGRVQRILEPPLFLLLDILDRRTGPAFEAVQTWLHGLSTLEHIFQTIFSRLGQASVEAIEAEHNSRPSARRKSEEMEHLSYILTHIYNILQYGNDWTWQCLAHTSYSDASFDEEHSCLVFLAQWCVRTLGKSGVSNHSPSQLLTDILTLLLSGPAAAELRSFDLEALLLDHLMECVSRSSSPLQVCLLRLVRLSHKLRFLTTTPESAPKTRTRATSISTRKNSLAFDSRPPTSASSSSPAPDPPSQLFKCIQRGFSSPNARYHLDEWLALLADVLLTISSTIFVNLLPLVECLSSGLSLALEQMTTLSRRTQLNTAITAPEGVAMALLDGLEMVLDRAYECMMDDAATESVSKEHEAKQTFLAGAMSGVFKADGVTSKTSKSNNRLTVILALQDAVRISLRMWLWASKSSAAKDIDESSAATTAYNALKVRNKTRHLLEQIFSVELLESLEVIIAHWCNASSEPEAAAGLSLLHVMQVSRPKNVVPAILDALCARTNPSAASTTRNSSLTIDLSPSDVASFLSAYLNSTEDDAMDEVWPDCMTFLRDVLANPLPHRQVLPHLLSTILLLAEKANNTNFGEQRKMRKDLGDIFQRLLTATFTTLPSGHVAELATEDSIMNGDNLRRYADIERSMRLLPVLKRVTARLDLILESADRIGFAINSIANNLLATTFKARSFPKNVNQDLLELIVQMTRKAPMAKTWKKEVGDAFIDPKLLASSPELMVSGWYPVLHQLSLYDKERMPEMLSRLAPPSTAGIMFGVGASAARLEADRKTQHNLRRMCLMLLASPQDTYVAQLRPIEEKIAELFEADASSSPSAAIKAELFMLCRALTLSVSTIHLSPLWPIINDKMQAAMMSMMPNSQHANDFNNLSLLQGCKLLDLLVALSPDEFQLHEWLYITDTIDAVYQSAADWTPSALADQIAETLNATQAAGDATPETLPVSDVGKRRPLLGEELPIDKDDIRALPREEFIHTVLKPFLSQLSIHAYEGTYSLEQPDVKVLRNNLLEDLLDLGTVVE